MEHGRANEVCVQRASASVRHSSQLTSCTELIDPDLYTARRTLEDVSTSNIKAVNREEIHTSRNGMYIREKVREDSRRFFEARLI